MEIHKTKAPSLYWTIKKLNGNKET